jgi:hypothetical protein
MEGWEDDIRRKVIEIGREIVDWIYLTQYRDISGLFFHCSGSSGSIKQWTILSSYLTSSYLINFQSHS